MSEKITPEVGMGITRVYGTDREPGTITEVLRFKTGERAGEVCGFKFRMDNWKVVSGSEHDGTAQYEYLTVPIWPEYTAMKNKHGAYAMVNSGTPISVGTRRRYYDPHF